jgi:hypothetical protein
MMHNDYYGHPVGVLQNEFLRLEYLVQAGPRIVRLSLSGNTENLLAETPDVNWETPYGVYHLFGGHRLWYAPEKAGLTSLPDDSGVQIDPLDHGVRLVGACEVTGGLVKTLDVRLQTGKPGVEILHYLTNHGDEPLELAPWAITQLPLGGQAILPQPSQPVDSAGVQPNRLLVLWPYTRWCDPRLRLGDEMIIVDGISLREKFKIGYHNRHGWAGYLRHGIFFGKRFDIHGQDGYADSGCNLEVYCDHRFLELETLGPLCTLAPGETAKHKEEWIILPGVEGYENLEDMLMDIS